MAVTTYGVNDTLAVKLWAKKLDAEFLKETYFGRFTGTSADSLIQIKTDLQKGAGDRLTYGLRMQLTGDGVTEGTSLEGNEESLTTYSDNLLINELNHAVRVGNQRSISQERVPFNLRDEAKSGLRDWYAGRLDQIFFNHICGNVAVTDARYNGNNTIIAPTASRIIRAGAVANDQSLGSGNTFTLDLIDQAVEIAKIATPVIRPIKYKGGDYYVCFLYPSQVRSLRTATAAGQWLDIQKAAMTGGMVTDNPIFTGALGVYNNVILHEAVRVTQGVNSSTSVAVANTRRAVLCGAQAAVLGWGSDFSDGTRFSWVEELFDYERELGVAAKSVVGMKKTVFNSVDFGTVVISTYSAN